MNDVANAAESPMTLYLPNHLDLQNFARKLLAVQEIYSELCMLLSIAESSHPLRISKIESGSLWTKLFGDTRVVGLMISFIENTAGWMFRSYTAEGKISSVPRKVEMIDQMLGLTERLTKAGIDTSVMKENIQKSAVQLSKNLSELLDGESSVTVNNHTLSVGSESSKAMLGTNVPLKWA